MLDRRSLLRGALAASAGATVAAAISACTPSESSESSVSALPDAQVPQELAEIPQDFRGPATDQGTLVELHYDTWESMSYEQQSQKLTKRAIIYLPYGYSENVQYDVFYLMHGGWSNETSTLGTPDSPSELKNILDHGIAEGRILPQIIVCPTYNNTSREDSASFSLALTLTQNYHRELLNDLLPAVEGAYSGYAASTGPEALAAARDHRGFGGFSMGAVTTWRTFQNGLDYFRYFLPMSCGTSLDMEVILDAAQERGSSDFFIGVTTGSEDFAYPYDRARVDLLRRSTPFRDSDLERDGNFVFRVKEGYQHDAAAAREYTFNGLSWLWRQP